MAPPPPSSSPPPSGWEAIDDPKSGKTYYHNVETGQTRWTLPPPPPPPPSSENGNNNNNDIHIERNHTATVEPNNAMDDTMVDINAPMDHGKFSKDFFIEPLLDQMKLGEGGEWDGYYFHTKPGLIWDHDQALRHHCRTVLKIDKPRYSELWSHAKYNFWKRTPPGTPQKTPKKTPKKAAAEKEHQFTPPPTGLSPPSLYLRAMERQKKQQTSVALAEEATRKVNAEERLVNAKERVAEEETRKVVNLATVEADKANMAMYGQLLLASATPGSDKTKALEKVSPTPKTVARRGASSTRKDHRSVTINEDKNTVTFLDDDSNLDLVDPDTPDGKENNTTNNNVSDNNDDDVKMNNDDDHVTPKRASRTRTRTPRTPTTGLVAPKSLGTPKTRVTAKEDEGAFSAQNRSLSPAFSPGTGTGSTKKSSTRTPRSTTRHTRIPVRQTRNSMKMVEEGQRKREAFKKGISDSIQTTASVTRPRRRSSKKN